MRWNQGMGGLVGGTQHGEDISDISEYILGNVAQLQVSPPDT